MSDTSDRQRREEALRALADGQARAGAPGTSPTGTGVWGARRSGARRWISLGIVVALAVVAIGGALLWPRLTRPPTPTQALVLHVNVRQFPEPANKPTIPDYSIFNIACPEQAAWSPNGRYFVVLGWAQCSTGGSPPQSYNAIIYRYKQRSATPIAAISFEMNILTQTLPDHLRDQIYSPDLLRQVRLRVFDSVWSPDGLQFAAFFVIGRQPDGQPDSAIIYDAAGINYLKIDANGDGGGGPMSPSSSLLSSLRQQHALTAPTSWRVPPLAWQLTSMGTSGGTPDYTAILAGDASPITPSAQSYTWTADNTLQPASASNGAAPIGNPAGGESAFSIWQPGVLTACADGAYMYSNEMPAWSPDMSRLITGLGIQATLTALSGPSSGATPTSGGACASMGKTAQLPMRDAGLASAVAALNAKHQTTAHIAWRPDGKLLAVAPSANGASDIVKGDDPVVLFYDCQTGKPRGQITAAQLQEQAPLLDISRPAEITALAWSPEGDSVLVVDGARQMLALVATP